MLADTLPNLLNLLQQMHLLTAEQWVFTQRQLAPGAKDSRTLAKALVLRKWLTTYQVNEIFLGRGEQLLLGSYVLLEKLGEGGMGQVFKARNWKLGQIVAVKLIRKERLSSENTLRRFYREIRAASQLQDPNIVRALDAGEEKGSHFFVMEYVDGKDLAHLVKDQGPLPVAQAVEFLRQAAVGLQHAFERGMVHRDIKPHNLLVTGDRKEEGSADGGPRSMSRLGPTVKILDMGLALVSISEDGDQTSTMTQEGAVMGTPDYIAPEQGMDSHRVDIRADLYSLGCTLYFALAGRPPFPGGSLTEKLLKHQLNQPEPIQKLRPDVPNGLANLLNRLLAKKPEERYQTPGELAKALEQVLSGTTPTTSPPPQVPAVVPESPALQDTPGSHLPTFDSASSAVKELRKQSAQRQALTKRLLWIGGGVALAVILVLALPPMFRKGRNTGPPVLIPDKKKEIVKKVEPPPDPLVTPVDEDWVKAVAHKKGRDQVDMVFDKLRDLNANWEGLIAHRLDNTGQVTALTLKGRYLSNLTPLRALPFLKELTVQSSTAKTDGHLRSLAPLAALALTSLSVNGHPVTDLPVIANLPLKNLDLTYTGITDVTALQDMPLETLTLQSCPVTTLVTFPKLKTLNLSYTKVEDLTPLQGAPLQDLNINSTPIKDLSPLVKMPLKVLKCATTKVVDFSVLAKMRLEDFQAPGLYLDVSVLQGLPLKNLNLGGAKFGDLEPLRNLPLETLTIATSFWRDRELLKKMSTLKTINGKVRDQFVADYEAVRILFDEWAETTMKLPLEDRITAVQAKLKNMNKEFTGKLKVEEDKEGNVVAVQLTPVNLEDPAALRAFPKLQKLDCSSDDKKPGRLKGLWALRTLPLTEINLKGSGLTDFSSLKGLPLTSLNCSYTTLADLSFVAGMPLETLDCGSTKVTDFSPLATTKIKTLWCNYLPNRDAKVLKGIPSLTRLNGNDAKELLK